MFTMVALTGVIALISLASTVGHAVHLAWRRKIGSSGFDSISNLCFDRRGQITAAVWTQGALDLWYGESGGSTSIVKYDDRGGLVGDVPVAASFDRAPAIALDASDNVHVSGSLADHPWYTARLSSTGSIVWDALEDTDEAVAPLVAVDTSGDVYTTGIFRDLASVAAVQKYNSEGLHQWTRRLGNDSTTPICSVMDSMGNLYVVGNAALPIEVTAPAVEKRWVAFAAKFSPDGDLLASFQSDPLAGEEVVHACAIDSTDNLYVAGKAQYAANTLQLTPSAMLMQFNRTGSLHWTHHVVDRRHLQFTAVATDAQRNVYVTGEHVAVRSSLIVVMKFDSDGTQLWSHAMSTRSHDVVTSILVDSAVGRIFMAGLTYDADRDGRSQAFLLQLAESTSTSTSGPAARLRLSVPPRDDQRGGHDAVSIGLLMCCVVLVSLVIRHLPFKAVARVIGGASVDVANDPKSLGADGAARDAALARRFLLRSLVVASEGAGSAVEVV